MACIYLRIWFTLEGLGFGAHFQGYHNNNITLGTCWFLFMTSYFPHRVNCLKGRGGGATRRNFMSPHLTAMIKPNTSIMSLKIESISEIRVARDE